MRNEHKIYSIILSLDVSERVRRRERMHFSNGKRQKNGFPVVLRFHFGVCSHTAL